jgi:hypothetical protein
MLVTPEGIRDQMIDWIRSILSRQIQSYRVASVEDDRHVGFVEEKPNVWRVIYVDNRKN